jgi:hypothetical protein
VLSFRIDGKDSLMEGPRLIQCRVVGGATTISCDVTSLGSASPIRVVLTASYQLFFPASFRSRPFQTGCGSADLQNPGPFEEGTVLSLLACEASALVAANAASYA